MVLILTGERKGQIVPYQEFDEIGVGATYDRLIEEKERLSLLHKKQQAQMFDTYDRLDMVCAELERLKYDLKD